MAVNKKIVLYQTLSGKEPFSVWRKKLKDPATIARIDNRINNIALGYYGDYKDLGDNLLEFRLHFGAGYRIYAAEFDGALLLLLSGGSKNTLKEQRADIAQARLFLKEFLER